jgi:hypothetical protein
MEPGQALFLPIRLNTNKPHGARQTTHAWGGNGCANDRNDISIAERCRCFEVLTSWHSRLTLGELPTLESAPSQFHGIHRGTPRLLEQVPEVMRLHHYSLQTERSYIDWIKRYVGFHRMQSRAVFLIVDIAQARRAKGGPMWTKNAIAPLPAGRLFGTFMTKRRDANGMNGMG